MTDLRPASSAITGMRAATLSGAQGSSASRHAERIADSIVRTLRPRAVLHVGEDGDSLSAALRDRGIARLETANPDRLVDEASSPTATQPRYDVAICLGGLATEGADRLAQRLVGASDAVVVSFGRTDREARPGVSRSLMDWLQVFAAFGFEPQVLFDLSPMAPEAVLLRKTDGAVPEALLVAAVEIVRQRTRLTLLEAETGSRTSRRPNGDATDRGRSLDATPSQQELLLQQRTLERRVVDIKAALDDKSSETIELQKRLAQRVREAVTLRLQAEARRSSAEAPEIGASLARRSLLDRLRDPFETRSRRARRIRRRVIAILERSGFVDPDWYGRSYAGTVPRGASAVEHYVRAGATELRNPSGLFSTRRYVAAYPDAVSTGLNPLLHYLAIGQKEGRQAFAPEPDRSLIATSELFDADWYRTVYPDVAAAGIDPALHYLESGAKEERDPGPNFSTRYYLECNPELRTSGVNPLLHYLEIGLPEGRSPMARSTHHRIAGIGHASDRTASALVAAHLQFCRPLRTYAGVHDRPRLTVLTDSVNAGSLFGGVATAIVLGTLLSDRMGADLRIVTRSHPVEPRNVANVLAAHGIDVRPNIEFGLAPYEGPDAGFDFGPNDTLMTTSWWGTRAAVETVDPKRIIYLIQEDERMFYAHGDEHLACSEMMSLPSVRYVVNSELLYRFFESERLDDLTGNGRWFEPAFPISSYHWSAEGRMRQKHNFFFYARPRNHRNLFHRGLQVIDEALTRGIIHPDRWDIHLAGNAIPDLTFTSGVEPIIHPLMEWDDYGRFVRSIDLGLSLMYTPHPSYPPLDVAASGGVSLTNTFANKRDLSAYSNNILCAPADLEAMMSGLQEAVTLALDPVRRKRNYETMNLRRDWRETLEPVLAWLTR